MVTALDIRSVTCPLFVGLLSLFTSAIDSSRKNCLKEEGLWCKHAEKLFTPH